MVQNKYFEEIHGNFGFGCMRLPMLDDKNCNDEEFIKMIDAFLACGLNYFDTAHGYLGGESERALKRCLTSRIPREKFLLTNKLSSSYFEKEEDIIPFFESQLEICGVEYFDFYLMHAQNHDNFPKYKKCKAYETAFKLKEMGKIHHVGLSFHDKAEVLDQILTEYPQIEVVQIQFNYVDYEDENVQSRKVYEVCEKHGKPVIVMEPVKGGSLVNLPEKAKQVYKDLNPDMSVASYAVRFAANFPQMTMVLSGMSNFAQMEDNLSFMADYKNLSEAEMAAIQKVCDIFHSRYNIPCTGCHYCVLDNKCPKNIAIPELFTCYNEKQNFQSSHVASYKAVMEKGSGKASECLKCGKCEKICPQNLPIRQLLTEVAKEFE